MFYLVCCTDAEQFTIFYYVIFLGRENMSRRCEICGKGTMSGNTVSKSKNHQRRTWKPNLVEVKTEIEGTTTTVKLCTRCLRSGYIVKKV